MSVLIQAPIQTTFSHGYFHSADQDTINEADGWVTAIQLSINTHSTTNVLRVSASLISNVLIGAEMRLQVYLLGDLGPSSISLPVGISCTSVVYSYPLIGGSFANVAIQVRGVGASSSVTPLKGTMLDFLELQ